MSSIPTGTDPNLTIDDILTQELDKLKLYRKDISESNQQYLTEHPEIRPILDNFITEVLNSKPSDIIKFGSAYFQNLYNEKGATKLGPSPLIICGPSGVGKGTIINRLLKQFPEIFTFSTSHTTRAPRDGEVDGVHYYFISKQEFEEAIDREEFVEYAKVHTNYYGTSLKELDKIKKLNKICVLDIDIQGYQTIKKKNLQQNNIFITAPSIESLENRLKGRGTESLDKIKIRLENAIEEINFGLTEGNFDRVFVNDDLEETYKQILLHLSSIYPNLDIYIDTNTTTSNNNNIEKQ